MKQSIISLLLLISLSGFSQTPKSLGKTSLGVMVSPDVVHFNRHNLRQFPKYLNYTAGIQLLRSLGSRLELVAGAHYSQYTGNLTRVHSSCIFPGFPLFGPRKELSIGLHSFMRYNFWNNRRVTPHLDAGMTLVRQTENWSPELYATGKWWTNVQVQLGAGLNYNINSRLNLSITPTMRWWLTSPDGPLHPWPRSLGIVAELTYRLPPKLKS